MGLFSKKNKDEIKPEKKEDFHVRGHDKMPSSSGLHDPILKAVHELQPFEQMTSEHATAAITPSGALRDIFGKPILNPDLSNPARAREERPLDTIRSFEYSTTGDERIKDTMETVALGFRPRQEFNSMPRYETNPYSNNVISFGDPNAPPDSTDTIQQNEYFLSSSGKPVEKKKKRGLFGKKK